MNEKKKTLEMKLTNTKVNKTIQTRRHFMCKINKKTGLSLGYIF